MNTITKRRVLSDLFAIRTPQDLLDTVLADVSLSAANDDGGLIARAYDVTVRLYNGKWEHYRASDTNYHDIWHAAETFLAMGRLISGALREGVKFTPREIALGLTAAILHDVGYIRGDEEKQSLTTRLRAIHEKRSMDFLKRHGDQFSLSTEEINDCCTIIQGTIIAEDITAIAFRSEPIARLGRMLAAADLLAQLSSSTYLEKLVDLYAEDQNDKHPHFNDLLDCFQKAIIFDGIAHDRIQKILPPVDAYLHSHFKARWNDPRNLYVVAVKRQKQRLVELLRQNDFNPHRHLRRWGSRGEMRRIFAPPIN